MRNPTRPLPDLFLRQDRPLTVTLVGCGGNGSECLDGLIKIHQGLIALGAVGLDVTAFDDDVVSSSNIVRQRFWPHEIGLSKSDALIQRSNMLMGTAWTSVPRRFEPRRDRTGSLLVTAVDNVSTRQAIAGAKVFGDCLWLDMGCEGRQGQVILGAIGDNALTDDIPNVVAHFPDLVKAVDDNRPSCSAADSIRRQDLMINSVVAASAINLLWQSFRSGVIPFNGTVIDLSTGSSQAIPFLGR